MAEGPKRLGLAKSRKTREAALEAAFSIAPNPDDPKYQPSLGGGGRGLIARKSSPPFPATEGPTEAPRHDRPTLIPRGDRPSEAPGHDRPSEESIPLSSLQWDVWQALKIAAAASEVISYRQLAERINAKPRGVERAVEVIQKEGGILSKTTIRMATTQGFQVEVNLGSRFHRVERNVTYGVLKRGGTGVPRRDPHSMFVCKNTNIQTEDLKTLQEAFEKNGRPLMTEREIEARLDQKPAEKPAKIERKKQRSE